MIKAWKMQRWESVSKQLVLEMKTAEITMADTDSFLLHLLIIFKVENGRILASGCGLITSMTKCRYCENNHDFQKTCMNFQLFQDLNCCSNLAISFHYISPDMMILLEYLIYHLHPFGYKFEDNDEIPTSNRRKNNTEAITYKYSSMQ